MAAAAAAVPSSPSNETTANTIPIYMTDESLMKHILQLSKKESTFRGPFTTTASAAAKVPSTSSRRGQDDPPATTFGGGGGGGKKYHSSNNNKTSTTAPMTPPTSSSSKFTFVWNDVHIQSCRRLLDIDPNLSKMYTRLCKGKDKETRILFWKNYFYHCDQVKAASTSSKATGKLQPGTMAATSQQQQEEEESITMSKSDAYNTMVDTVVGDRGMRRKFDRVISSLDNEAEDDNSLIPASSTDGEHDDDHDDDDDGADDPDAKHSSDRLGLGGDDSSYVLASPPTSLNTYLTTRSNDEDDIVVVNSR
mmetsp:Transcript_25580/g.60476  ORF Transcript_25580/g.60476 Transcript_25580/m.60476 type:complete len:307 (-) Transcript_25580:83-1003(-)